MSILYIGPYRQTDEWGYTSKAVAKLLAEIDPKLAIRPVWFNNDNRSEEISIELQTCETNKVESRDIIIQHGLPSYLNYDGRFKKNIAITSIDCNIENTDWVTHLNMFDLVVVFSDNEHSLLRQSRVSCKTTCLPFPPTILTENKREVGLNLSGVKFYTDGSLDIKSGLREVIAGYLSGFSIMDNATLIVMTNDPKDVEKEISSIKRGLGIYSNDKYYGNIAIVNNTDKDVMAYMHEYADFYVDASYNPRVSQNLLGAIVGGSIPIVMNSIGYLLGDNDRYFFRIEEHLDSCIYHNRPIAGLYSGDGCWDMPVIDSIKDKMKFAFDLQQNGNDEYVNQDILEQTRQKLMLFRQEMFSKPKEIMERILCSH